MSILQLVASSVLHKHFTLVSFRNLVQQPANNPVEQYHLGAGGEGYDMYDNFLNLSSCTVYCTVLVCLPVYVYVWQVCYMH